MIHSESRRVSQAIRQDVRQDPPSLLFESKPPSHPAPLTPMNIASPEPPPSDGALAKNPYLERLTLEEIEAILPDEYIPLTQWTAKKLALDYGVRDLGKLQIVDPIAEELVHDTIVRLWEKAKAKTLELSNASHIRGWLINALKRALLRWVQKRAREHEKHVYFSEIEKEEQDRSNPEIIEPWEVDNKKSVRHREEAVFEQTIDDSASAPAEQEQAVLNELKAALEDLPRDIQKLIFQVYRDQVSWREAGAVLNVDGKALERETLRWLYILRPHIPSYQPSPRPSRQDTRRVRKSFICPVCDTPVKRQKGNNGGGCTRCEMRIHKDQFAIQYSYHV